MEALKFQLTDVYSDKCPEKNKVKECKVVAMTDAMNIYIKGYGNGQAVACLELRNGVPWLVVWNDVNNDEPKQISLAKTIDEELKPEDKINEETGGYFT